VIQRLPLAPVLGQDRIDLCAADLQAAIDPVPLQPAPPDPRVRGDSGCAVEQPARVVDVDEWRVRYRACCALFALSLQSRRVLAQSNPIRMVTKFGIAPEFEYHKSRLRRRSALRSIDDRGLRLPLSAAQRPLDLLANDRADFGEVIWAEAPHAALVPRLGCLDTRRHSERRLGVTQRSCRPAEPITVTIVRREATPNEWQRLLDVLLEEQRSRRGRNQPGTTHTGSQSDGSPP